MKANDLDGEVPVEGDVEETFNPYRDGLEGHVILRKEVRIETATDPITGEEEPIAEVTRTETMPITDEDTGGFEGRYGPWTPDDPSTGPMGDYEPDMKDQLTNRPLGSNGPYDVYDTTVGEGNMPGGSWPADGDLTVNQVISWARARNDEAFASKMEHLKEHLGL